MTQCQRHVPTGCWLQKSASHAGSEIGWKAMVTPTGRPCEMLSTPSNNAHLKMVGDSGPSCADASTAVAPNVYPLKRTLPPTQILPCCEERENCCVCVQRVSWPVVWSAGVCAAAVAAAPSAASPASRPGRLQGRARAVAGRTCGRIAAQAGARRPSQCMQVQAAQQRVSAPWSLLSAVCVMPGRRAQGAKSAVLTSAPVSARMCTRMCSSSICCCRSWNCSACSCRTRLLTVGRAAGEAVAVGMGWLLLFLHGSPVLLL